MSSLSPSKFLSQNIETLSSLTINLPVLDLACGAGRNGIFCLQHALPVRFADINQDNLKTIKHSLAQCEKNNADLASFWCVDFEQNVSDILVENSFSAVMVFRYLHRPLMDQIKSSVATGGVVIYETFTTEQRQYGRPKRSDFLLKPGELVEFFSDWEILHSFEGVKKSDTAETQEAVAQIVARKL
jgi:SAM-dependent methyltransferase